MPYYAEIRSTDKIPIYFILPLIYSILLSRVHFMEIYFPKPEP